jgi:hypothetical protein
MLEIWEPNVGTMKGIVTVTFTNGKASGVFTPYREEDVAGGQLTITGLSQYAGKTLENFLGYYNIVFNDIYAYERVIGYYYGDDLEYFNPVYYSSITITDDSVTINLFRYEYDPDNPIPYQYFSYTGNDQDIVLGIRINSDEVIDGTITVTFTNGIGSGAFVPNPY